MSETPEWEEGEIIRVRPERLFIIVGWRGGSLYSYVKDWVCPNGHECMFLQPCSVGLPVTFKLGIKNGWQRATNVTLNTPYELDEWEESTLTCWTGYSGFLSRDVCGCPLYIGSRELNGASIRVGDRVPHRVGQKQNGAWFAKDVILQ
jgi:hypothetical protein